MEKRWKVTGLVIMLAVLTLGACGNDDKGDTVDKIRQAGKIRVGVKVDQPGFGQNNPITSKPEGFDIEIAKLIAQAIFGGTKDEAAEKIEFSEAKSKDREAFIQQDKVDLVVATYTINDERKKVIDFAGPYYTAHGDILVKSDNNTINTVEDLNGRNVCVVQGSTYPATISAKAPQAKQLALDTNSLCEQAVQDGRVEAMATDGPILIGLVSKSKETEKVLNTNYTDEPYGIGLKKGDEKFRAFLNDTLQRTYDNGDWAKAFESTVGMIGIPTPQPPAIDRYSMTA